jgi:hypothetical protein
VQVLFDPAEQLNDILPINNVLLKLQPISLSSFVYTELAGGQALRTPQRTLLCRAARRRQAVAGAGLDDASRAAYAKMVSAARLPVRVLLD